jgi:beta-lactamase class A
METWPDRTPTTLATYATQMISISDNTAADAVAHIVGARALAPFTMGNEPFLTTRELFFLKSTRGAAQRARFRAATTADARRSILGQVDALGIPSASEVETSPMLDIEWHYTVRDLCGFMARVDDLPVFSVNPGLADPSAFAHVAFKGGSEIGVINMTTSLTTKRGTHLCISATLDDAERRVDDVAFERAYGAVLGALADR